MGTIPTNLTPPYQTISQRKVPVSMKLGNRADLLQPAAGSGASYSRISGWLRDAYIAVTAVRTFEQTEVTYNFTTTQGADTYQLPWQVRAMKSFEGYDSTGTPIHVSWKNMAYIRRYNPGTQPPSTGTFQSRPSIYTIWGQSIVFRPTPDNAYTFYMDAWQRPQITGDVDSTPLLVPDEWLEVVDYEAAVRGNAELQQEDKSRNMQELLYGFTDPNTGRFVPGIIERMESREEASAPYVDWGIQPVWSHGYTK